MLPSMSCVAAAVTPRLFLLYSSQVIGFMPFRICSAATVAYVFASSLLEMYGEPQFFASSSVSRAMSGTFISNRFAIALL